MKLKETLMFLAVVTGVLLAPTRAHAGVWEIAVTGGFNRSNYTKNNYSWTRRYGVSLGYYFTETSQIELAFQDVLTRTFIESYEDTTFHDNIYSASWVQSLMPKDYAIQPFIKAGAGQVYRTITGTYGSQTIPRTEVSSLTGILGFGLKVPIGQRLGIKGEATSYLVGGSLGTWKDNYALSAGVSLYF